MRLLALLVGLLLKVDAADIHLSTLESSVLQERFARFQLNNEDRARVLRGLFAEVGCTGQHWREQAVKGSKLANLICTLPGTSERQVIVTSHYDRSKDEQGAINNWSGAVLLPSLYASLLAETPRTLTYVFLLTTDEDKLYEGSREYMRQLKDTDIQRTILNVDITSIGMKGPTFVRDAMAEPKFLNEFGLIAKTLGVPVGSMNLGKLGDGNSGPFFAKQVPMINIHSLNQETARLMHTQRDVPQLLDAPSYYNTYRLIAAFLAYLDTQAAPHP